MNILSVIKKVMAPIKRISDRLYFFYKNHRLVTVATIISFALLALFMWMQSKSVSALALDNKWIFVSFLPILLALLLGGYIKSFKGFGLEIESSLKKPVSTNELQATKGLRMIQREEKQRLDHIYRMPDDEKRKTKILSFVQGRRDYYDDYVISEYFNNLKELEYFEIKDSADNFIALLPTKIFKFGEPRNERPSFQEFINILEQSKILEKYAESVITKTTSSETSLIKCLSIMKINNIKHLVVVDSDYKYLGTLSEYTVKRLIINYILEAEKNIHGYSI